MAREDRSQEILQRKQRASRQHGFFSYEIDSLQRRWSKTRDSADTTPDFFVVRLVTVMEVFARRGYTYGTEFLLLNREDKQKSEQIRRLAGHGIAHRRLNEAGGCPYVFHVGIGQLVTPAPNGLFSVETKEQLP